MGKRASVLLMTALSGALIASACASSSGPASTSAGPKATTTTSTSKPATQQAGGTGGAGDAANGKDLYAQNCSSCHGPDAKGLPGLGKDLTASTFTKGLNDAQYVAFIKQGRPAGDPANTTKVDMPPKGGNPALTDAQLNDIVAYLRTIEQ